MGPLRTLRVNARASLWKIALGAALIFVAACDNPEQAEATYFEQGKSFFEKGQYEKARLEFLNAYQINPTNAETIYHIGLIAEARQKWREAFGAYSKAVIQSPNHVGAMIRLKIGRASCRERV